MTDRSLAENLNDDSLIKDILRYNGINNFWRDECYIVLNTRHDLGLICRGRNNKDNDFNMKILMNEFPEYFL